MPADVIAHADWSALPRKRWAATAVRDDDGRYEARAPQPADDALGAALERVKPGFVVDQLARIQVPYPTVPIVFCGTRKLAEEWTYRFLGAARAEAEGDG